MKNTFEDLHNHLFCQLERLGDEDLSDEELEKECKRSVAIVGIAKQIVSAANVTIQASKLIGTDKVEMKSIPKYIHKEEKTTPQIPWIPKEKEEKDV